MLEIFIFATNVHLPTHLHVLGWGGGSGIWPPMEIMEPNGSQGRGIPGKGEGTGKGTLFFIIRKLNATANMFASNYQSGIAKSQATGAQLESPDAIGSHIVLTLVSHRSHIGLTPSTPTTPRFFPILSEFLFRKVASISFVSKCCPNYSSTQPPQAPQEFCQRCPNSCFEMLPALVSFRNVARITTMEPLGKATKIWTFFFVCPTTRSHIHILLTFLMFFNCQFPSAASWNHWESQHKYESFSFAQRQEDRFIFLLSFPMFFSCQFVGDRYHIMGRIL